MSTKERILDAALTLFAENGYDGTSVEQIANAVGIKAPSLYKHFKGKEDILNRGGVFRHFTEDCKCSTSMKF